SRGICISGRCSNINGSAGEVESPSAGIAATFQIGQVKVTRLHFVNLVVQVRDRTRQGRVVFLQGVASLLNLIDGPAHGRDVVAQLGDLFTKGIDGSFDVVDVALDIVDFLVDFGLKVVNLLGYVGRKGIK